MLSSDRERSGVEGSRRRAALSEFWELGDVGGDTPCLLACEWLGRRPSAGLLLEVDVRDCLPVVIAHDKASLGFFGGPRRREAARSRHYVSPVQSRAASKISKAPGMTRAHANPKNGVMYVIATADTWTLV